MREKTKTDRLSRPTHPESSVPNISAYVDKLDQLSVEGWARNEDDPFSPVPVRILRNGIEVATLPAESWREDLIIPGHSDGCCAFSHIWPDRLPDNDLTLIDVRLPDGSSAAGAPRFVPSVAAIGGITSGITGTLDVLDHTRIAGWVRDEDRPDRAVGLRILLDGEQIAFVKANAFRPDLRNAGLGHGRYGFDFLFSSRPGPLTGHTIEIITDLDIPFPGGPRLLPSSRGLDDALRAAVIRATEGLQGDRKRTEALAFFQSCIAEIRRQGAEDSAGLLRRRISHRKRRNEHEQDDETPQVLVIDDSFPDSNRDAGSVAILSHMQALRTLGFRVAFAPSLPCPDSQLRTKILEKAGITVFQPPLWDTVEAILRNAGNAFDVVYLHRLSNASAYLELIRRLCPMTRIIWSVADLDHIRLARQADVEKRPELKHLAMQCEMRERMAAWRADLVITHSPPETGSLQKALPTAKVVTIPWALKVAATRYTPDTRSNIVFLGHFGHAPNIDAVRWLADAIVPVLQKLDPGLTITVRGSAITGEVLSFARPGLVIGGYEPDIRHIFADARLTIAPLRFGAGIKGKILESWARGVPVIMTPVAAEGLPLHDDQRDCLATDAPTFARAIFLACRNPDFLRKQSGIGKKLIRTHFSQTTINRAFRDVLSQTLNIKLLPA